jgi:hypothetical protein
MRLEHQLFVCYRRHLESRIETKIATIGVCIGQHHPSAGYSFSETGNPLFQGIHLHYDGSLQKPIQHNTDAARRSKSRTRAALVLRCRNWYDYIITLTWKKVKCLKSLIFLLFSSLSKNRICVSASQAQGATIKRRCHRFLSFK